MTIELNDTGKRFNRDWIFRSLNYKFLPGNTYAIIGPNGSGKSTLLQVLAGSLSYSEGDITWYNGNHSIDPESVFQHVSIAAPYLELVEEMTATEFLQFHAVFKPLLPSITIAEILAQIDLAKALHKQVRFYSSGMKQRLKLAQAIFSNVPIVLLDEPCTNLDKPGFALYHKLVETYCTNRTVVVSSNDVNEYDFCEHKLSIMDFKSA